MKWKYALGWIPLVIIAIANGVFRQIFFQQSLGELRAHQLSTAIGIILFGIYIDWLMRRWNPESLKDTIRIGGLWMMLTILFEFSLGRLVLELDWSVLLHDYNLLAGRVWVLVIIWVAVAPSVFFLTGKKNTTVR